MHKDRLLNGINVVFNVGHNTARKAFALAAVT